MRGELQELERRIAGDAWEQEPNHDPTFLKVHPKVAQAILRHSQISMTMDVYTHVVGSDQREATEMLAELLEDQIIG
ncbi:hypothetical protein [Streptomyces canus]|uniref:hypothetical protein n=1 Tax=Streptomyces canus TaxID=58343 RepID=UPI003F6AE122